MSIVPVAIAVGLIFGVGSCVGAKTADPGVDIVTIKGPVEYRTVPPPDPVVVSQIPQPCLDALVFAERIAKQSGGIYKNGDDQLGILSDIRMALADGRNTSDIEVRQRRLLDKSLKSLANLEASYYPFSQSYDECEALNE